MYETTSRSGIIARWRRFVARMALNYPTDPINVGLCILGGGTLIVTLLAGTPWPPVAAAALTLASGIAGMVVTRGQYVLYSSQVTIGGATLSLIAALLAFAPYNIWWISILPLGAMLSAIVVYYWGIYRGILWGAIQFLIAPITLWLAAPAGSATAAQFTQTLLAGETIILLLHLGVILFMPEKAEVQARNDALARQSYELNNLSLQISATADGMGKASSAIHMVTSQQSSGAEQQAAVITEAVTMLNEFIALAAEVRDQARSVAALSEQTAAISERGQRAISMTIEGMAQIRSQVTLIAHNIATLAEQMQRIDEIITTVSEIATQSNLVALNASIEAARAGTHGRGFAAVAEEVRILARQSKMAAAQVQSILSEIQGAMKETVKATEVGDRQADEGMALSRQAGEVITLLANNVNESTAAMHNIMTAIDQQATGMEQIARSMQNIHEVTQQNLESTRTAEIVAENLSRLSEELLTAISRYAGDSTDLA